MLYLLRHAKALRESPTGRDHDRALCPRGIEQATFIASALGRRGGACPLPPQHILTSPAVRARQTARIIGDVLGVMVEPKPVLAPNATPEVVTRFIGAILEENAPTLIVGHNPTLEEALLLATGDDDDPHLRTGELITLEPAQGRNVLARLIGRLRLDE